MSKINTLHQQLHANFVMPRRTRLLAEYINSILPSDISMLDVGCGNGKISELLLKYDKNKKVSGVDVFRREHCSISCTLYDGLELPFAPNSFDYVMLVDVLHHTNNPQTLLDQCAIIARKGIIIKDHIYSSRTDFVTLALMDWFGNRSYDVALPWNYLKWSDWQTVFKDANLKLECIKNHLNFYPFPISLLCDRNLHFIASLTKE